MDFNNRHVVVTGGTGALGAAVVGMLLEAGATCHVPYVTPSSAERFVHRDNPRVVLSQANLDDETAVTQFYASVPQLWASIHLAGGFAGGSVAKTTLAKLNEQITTNFTTAFLCCHGAVNAMLASGGGRIVNVASRPALEWRTGAGMTAYAASKAAVAVMTVSMAEEVAKHDILVNAVAPSTMDTAANRAAMPKADFDAWPKVEEVAATILFLASPDNKVTRGAVLPVYGKT